MDAPQTDAPVSMENTTANATAEKSSGDTTPDIVVIIQCVVAGVGIISNATVITVFANHKKFRRKIPNKYIINQSSVDFVCSLFLLLTSLTVKDALFTHTSGWLGDLECGIWNSRLFLWGPLVSSTWNLVCLTVERYIELVHPFWHKAHVSMRWIYGTMAFSWCFGCGMNAAYMIPTGLIVDGECRIYFSWPSESWRIGMGVFFISIQFFVPFLILVVCYGRILWMLSRRINTNVSDAESSTKQSNANTAEAQRTNTFQKARKNTIKTLLIVGCCFIICWSQNQFLYLMYNFGYDLDWNSIYFHFTVLMVFFNCTVNPFIYLIEYQDYQIALKEFLKCNREKGDQSENSFSSLQTSVTDK